MILFLCADVNECNIANSCAVNSTCTNIVGDYICNCFEGYSGDPRLECFDINECLDFPCDTDAECMNSVGSFACVCNSGYAGNGTFCTGNLRQLVLHWSKLGFLVLCKWKFGNKT